MANVRRGGASLAEVMAIRAQNPGYSFSGLPVSQEAYNWLATNRPGTPTQYTGTDNINYGAERPQEFAPQESTAPDEEFTGRGSGARSPGLLASSPEWLAYLNSLGLEENQFRADIDRQRNAIQSEVQRQTAGVEPDYALQRHGITASAESRGVAGSGELAQRLAQNRAAQGRTYGNIAAGGASQLSGLESSLAQRLIDIGARRSQQELSMRGQGYQ